MRSAASRSPNFGCRVWNSNGGAYDGVIAVTNPMATTMKTGRNKLAMPVLVLASAITGVIASCAGATGSGSAAPRAHSRFAGQMVVRVVDESGTPIAGAKVSGSVEVNPGPTASFCCMPETYGKAVTGADGRAFLPRSPMTSRPITITAIRDGWPERTVSVGNGMFGGPSELTIVVSRRRVPAVPAR